MATALFLLILGLAVAGIAALLRGAGVRHRAITAGLLAGVLLGPGVAGRIVGDHWAGWVHGAASERRELAAIERRFLADRLAASAVAPTMPGGRTPTVTTEDGERATEASRATDLRHTIDRAAAERRRGRGGLALLAFAVIAGSTWRRRPPPLEPARTSDHLPTAATMVHVGALGSLVPAVIAALTARVVGAGPAASLGAGVVAGCGPALLHGIDGWLADRVVRGGRRRLRLAGTISAGITIAGLLALLVLVDDDAGDAGLARTVAAVAAALVLAATVAVARSSPPPESAASASAPASTPPPARRRLTPDHWLAAGLGMGTALAAVHLDVMADISILATVILVLAAGDGRWAGAWLAMMLRQSGSSSDDAAPPREDGTGDPNDEPPNLEEFAGTQAAELPAPPRPSAHVLVPLALATGMATTLPVQVGLTAVLGTAGVLPPTIVLGLLIAAVVAERSTRVRRRTSMALALLAQADGDGPTAGPSNR